jgi:protein involved in polysaccharide export with SLBB domain
VTNALFASGGVKTYGSLRKIEVKRDGRLVRELDLYAVLLHGDTSNDVTLQTGDVVLVPPVGVQVGIDGEVRRPAIYELVKERTLAEVVALAGGLTPDADLSAVTVDRVGPKGERAAAVCDLMTPAGRDFPVRAGDTVRIGAVRPIVDNGIVLDGHTYHTGTYAWREGLRLTDVVHSIDDLEPRADQHYVLIRREVPGTRRVVAVSADLAAALAQPGSAADVPLNPRDRITVFDLTSPRDSVVDPLVAEMQRQSAPDSPAGVVVIDGPVNVPGTYPLEPGMRLSDLLRAGGGLKDSAYGVTAELTRYAIVNGGDRRAEVKQIDLGAVRNGDAAADVALNPYDFVSIRVTPEWERIERIELVGEVRFPGKYLIRRGETLSSVVERAGGLTSLAFAHGAVFTREELKQREREQLDRLATRLQSDLAILSLQSQQSNNGSAQAVSSGQDLLSQLRQAKPVGRLVINLQAALSEKTRREADVTLRGGDKLVVPRATEEVSILGEVQNPTSQLYHPGLTREDLIALGGGMTSMADAKRVYVVRADGSVVAQPQNWFSGGNTGMQPGDTVVVPPDAEKMRPLPMWTAVTTIIYNLAIAAAAIGRL